MSGDGLVFHSGSYEEGASHFDAAQGHLEEAGAEHAGLQGQVAGELDGWMPGLGSGIKEVEATLGRGLKAATGDAADTAAKLRDSKALLDSTEQQNARAVNAIRPKAPGVPGGNDAGGSPAPGAGSASGNQVANLLGKDAGPAAPPKWSITRSLRDKYAGEEVPGNSVWPGGSAVKYLSELERERYKLTVKEGKLYDARGRLFDTSKGQSLHHKDDPRAIFVMDKYGNIYASLEHAQGKFHHSSFLAGGDVAAAGELKASNGDLQLISNQSGHYWPTKEMTVQLLKELDSRGLPLDDAGGEIVDR